ncbi:copper resistance D family protein [Bacillus sp. PS06]|uniref:copper resistance D family protein n=1 Tax=Bacillus sp. PS06 TaxID=2764176 RepID=UPI0017869672|nr:CopD family protein [Bacillus sp. PS06]MBD8070662.1 CopD family protein [Bacillus sp. PS06]
MALLTILSQTLLFLSFSFLVGSFILLLAPNDYRPDVTFSKRLLMISSITLPIFAFVPVLDITLFLAPRLGFVDSLIMVVTSYTVGTAWSFTLLGSFLLLSFIAIGFTEKASFGAIGSLLTLGIILTVAWSSHAGVMDPFLGIIGDFLHLVAVSIWVGVLLIAGWFAKNHNHWLNFLKWYSLMAFSCLMITVVSGFLMMDVLVDDYVDSWMVSYGQGLLAKHLFILPLLFYALVNGLIVKYKLSKDTTFNPIPWVRLEGIILFVIFAITAFYSQQPPPHGNFLTSDAVSPLFQFFHGATIDTESTIGFVTNANTIFWLVISLLIFGLMVVSFMKKASIVISFLLSCLIVICVYVMIMVTVVVS